MGLVSFCVDRSDHSTDRRWLKEGQTFRVSDMASSPNLQLRFIKCPRYSGLVPSPSCYGLRVLTLVYPVEKAVILGAQRAGSRSIIAHSPKIISAPHCLARDSFEDEFLPWAVLGRSAQRPNLVSAYPEEALLSIHASCSIVVCPHQCASHFFVQHRRGHFVQVDDLIKMVSPFDEASCFPSDPLKAKPNPGQGP